MALIRCRLAACLLGLGRGISLVWCMWKWKEQCATWKRQFSWRHVEEAPRGVSSTWSLLHVEAFFASRMCQFVQSRGEPLAFFYFHFDNRVIKRHLIAIIDGFVGAFEFPRGTIFLFHVEVPGGRSEEIRSQKYWRGVSLPPFILAGRWVNWREPV